VVGSTASGPSILPAPLATILALDGSVAPPTPAGGATELRLGSEHDGPAHPTSSRSWPGTSTILPDVIRLIHPENRRPGAFRLVEAGSAGLNGASAAESRRTGRG
jgi:hypothetical protein